MVLSVPVVPVVPVGAHGHGQPQGQVELLKEVGKTRPPLVVPQCRGALVRRQSCWPHLRPNPTYWEVETRKLTQGTGHVFCRSESHTVVYGH